MGEGGSKDCAAHSIHWFGGLVWLLVLEGEGERGRGETDGNLLLS